MSLLNYSHFERICWSSSISQRHWHLFSSILLRPLGLLIRNCKVDDKAWIHLILLPTFKTLSDQSHSLEYFDSIIVIIALPLLIFLSFCLRFFHSVFHWLDYMLCTRNPSSRSPFSGSISVATICEQIATFSRWRFF